MKLRTRDMTPAGESWDLERLYPTLESWEQHYSELDGMVESFSAYRGTLGDSPHALRKALEAQLNFNRQLEKLYCFAHQRSDEDTSNTTHYGMNERARGLSSRASTAMSFFTPELLSLSSEAISSLLDSDELKPYHRLLSEIIRFKPHTLNSSEEELLSKASEALGSCDRVFSLLNNADLQFGNIERAGESIPISHGSISVLLKDRDRSLREQAFLQYGTEFEAHKNTLAATLSGAVKRNLFYASAKRYPSALERALFGENIPKPVYESLISTVNANLAPLHKYYEIRKRRMGLEQLMPWDTAVPLVADIDGTYSYADACEQILQSLKPLGAEYCEILRKGLLLDRWVDIYENKGKRSGAYSGGCYDSPPYILMNYHEQDIHSMFTLAHEAGHSMHSCLSRTNQPYHESEYSIFVAEVASTFNEFFLSHHLRETRKSDRRFVAFLINQQIDDILGALFLQTRFAEFEMKLHAHAEANRAITVETIQETYTEILLKYNGPAFGIHPLSWITAIRVPHFYYGFYVYKYATGISAAIALAERVLKGGELEREQYLGFLRSGGSKTPIDVLHGAGVDMTSPELVRRAIALFSDLVDELDRLLDEA